MATSADLELIVQLKDQASAGLKSINSIIATGLVGGAAAATGAILGIGAAAFSVASQTNQAVNEIQASLGVTREEAEALSDVTKEIFGDNFGADIADANQAVITIQQQFRAMGGIGAEETKRIAEGAFAIADSFDVDTNEAIGATRTLMEQFGISGEEALDFVTEGFRNGLNASDDFIDSINEYSTQFAQGGATADQFFSLMETGFGSGVLGTDKAADLFKEFTLRIADGSVTTANGLAQIGMSADEMNKKLASGELTKAEAFQLIISRLREMDDAVIRDQAGVALLGTQYEDLGLGAALNIDLANTKLEDMAGATDSLNVRYNNLSSVFEAFKRQALLALEPLGNMLLDLANRAMPYVISGFEQLRRGLESLSNITIVLGEVLGEAWDAAYTWGQGIIDQLAGGMASAAQAVVSVLQQLGSIIAGWLQPHSPPKILPDIDKWGKRTAEEWINGFADADLSGISDLGSAVENVLNGLVSAGRFDEAGVIPAVLGTESAIADAITQVDEFGNVSEDAIQRVIDSAGAAAPEVESLIRGFFDLRQATEDVERAQDELNRVTEDYAQQLAPLNANLKEIQDQKRAIDDQIRIKKLQDDIASGKLDDLEVQSAQLEIQEIQQKAAIDGLEEQRDAAVDAEQAKVDAAQAALDEIEAQQKQAESAISLTNHQNQLIGEQIVLMERLQQAAEAAASAGGGGGGGGSGISMPSLTTGSLGSLDTESITAPLQEVSKTIGTVNTELTEMRRTVDQTMARVGEVFSTAAAVVMEYSPVFQLLRGTVEAALPPILGIVETVFTGVTGFLQQNGASMLTDVQQTWAGIQALVNTVLPAIQAIVVAILGGIAGFIQEHGATIGETFTALWNGVLAIVQVTIDILNATIVPWLAAVAESFQQNSDSITTILNGAWTIIKSIVQGALTIIRGVLTTALGLITGDWDQTWGGVVTILQGAWELVQGVIVGALELIAGTMGTSLEELGTLWQNNWNMLILIAATVLAKVIKTIQDTVSDVLAAASNFGSNVVAGIRKGIDGGWTALEKYVAELAQRLLKAAMDAIGIESPSKAFRDDVGMMIPAGIAVGIEKGAQVALEALEDLSDDLRDVMEDLVNDLEDMVSDALIAGAEGAADMARTRLSAFKDLADLSTDIAAAAQAALDEADAQAQQLAQTDAAAAADYYKMRADQIIELAQLQQEISEATSEDERARLEKQLALVLDAQEKERAAFLTTYQVQGDASEQTAARVQETIDELLAQREAAQQALDEASFTLPWGHDSIVQQEAEIAALTEKLGTYKKGSSDYNAVAAEIEKQQSELEEMQAAWKTYQESQAIIEAINAQLPDLQALITADEGSVYNPSTDVGSIADQLAGFTITDQLTALASSLSTNVTTQSTVVITLADGGTSWLKNLIAVQSAQTISSADTALRAA